MSAWAVKDVKESWDTVFDRAWAGEPQFISRGDSETVVVVSLSTFKASKPKTDFSSFAGKIKWKEDPVAYQRRMRDDW